MTNHAPFLKRLAELTRNGTVSWQQSPEGEEFTAQVDNYTARLSFAGAGGVRPTASALRFALYSRDEKMVEIGARRTNGAAPDESAYCLKTLYDAVERQQAGRETAAFEDFFSRAEAS